MNVISTFAVMEPLRLTVSPAFERERGEEVSIDFNPTKIILDRISEGARADVLIAIDAAVAGLVEQGILRGDSVAPAAQVAAGVAKAASAPTIDISTAQSFKDALLNAKSIAISRAGASGASFLEIIEEMGIADEIKQKLVIIPNGLTGEKIISGEADIAIQQMSELMAVEGIDIIGEFPERYARRTQFSAAIFTDSSKADAAAAYIEHITSSQAVSAFCEGGLTPHPSTRT